MADDTYQEPDQQPQPLEPPAPPVRTEGEQGTDPLPLSSASTISPNEAADIAHISEEVKTDDPA